MWYRKWSDGWIEQGGYIAAGSSNSNGTKTFYKAFKNTNYTLSTASYRTNTLSDGYAYYLGSVSTKTTTTFKYYIDSSNYVTGFFWTASGY